MSVLELQVLQIRGMIAGLSESDQALIKIIHGDIRDLVQRNGDCGILAMTLIAAEMAAKENL